MDVRTRREKLAEMASRGTLHERAFARRYLEAHPLEQLSAAEILGADDSRYGPSGEDADAAIDAYVQRQARERRGPRRRIHG